MFIQASRRSGNRSSTRLSLDDDAYDVTLLRASMQRDVEETAVMMSDDCMVTVEIVRRKQDTTCMSCMFLSSPPRARIACWSAFYSVGYG